MLTVNGTELNPFFTGLIGAFLFFAIQIVLCLALRERTHILLRMLRITPILMLISGFIVCAMLIYNVLRTGGMVLTHTDFLTSSLFAVVLSLCTFGDILAWWIFGIIQRFLPSASTEDTTTTTSEPVESPSEREQRLQAARAAWNAHAARERLNTQEQRTAPEENTANTL